MPQTPARPIKLYRHPLSGHAHRAQLMLSLLGLSHELVDVDLRQGEHKRPAFLKLNPFGQVPVIDDDGTVVADSTAILVYLAKRYGGADWLPEDPAAAAEVQRWLSVASGPLAAGPARARLITVFGAGFKADEVIAHSHALLAVVEGALERGPFLAGPHATVADIAAYTYIAHAPEGNVSLAEYPNVRAWLASVEALPGFVPMQSTRAGLAA